MDFHRLALLRVVLHCAIFLATCVVTVLRDKLQVDSLHRVTSPFTNLSRNFFDLQRLHKVELGSTFCDNSSDFETIAS